MYSGIGAYPDQVWFDPNRPKFIPYFIDTPTESARKYDTLLVGNPSGVTSGVTTVSQSSINTGWEWESTNETDTSWIWVGISALLVSVMLFK